MAKTIHIEGKKIRTRGPRGVHKNYKIRERHTSRHAKIVSREKGPVK